MAQLSQVLGIICCLLWLPGLVVMFVLLVSLWVPHTPKSVLMISLLAVSPFIVLGGTAAVLAVISKRSSVGADLLDKSRRHALWGIVYGSVGALIAVPAAYVANRMGLALLRLWSAKRLKQLGIAAHDFQTAFDYMPLAIYDKSGRPLLSWRVLILPYIEQGCLYKEFKLEPWDSPHNIQLLKRMPGLFASGGWPDDDIAVSGLTRFKVFEGKEAPFNHGRRTTLGAIAAGDGSANTIFIAEAGDLVPWTKPEDLAYDPNAPLPNLDGPHEEGFFFADLSGAVHLLKKGAPEAVIRSLITHNGGETIPVSPWVD